MAKRFSYSTATEFKLLINSEETLYSKLFFDYEVILLAQQAVNVIFGDGNFLVNI